MGREVQGPGESNSVEKNHEKIGKLKQGALVAEVGKPGGQFISKALSRVQQLS